MFDREDPASEDGRDVDLPEEENLLKQLANVSFPLGAAAEQFFQTFLKSNCTRRARCLVSLRSEDGAHRRWAPLVYSRRRF
jgi:hypothetical protein